MREGTPIGVIILWRKQVRPFTEKQIELVTTFADQAVIAIENVRLFDEVQARTRELSEALEQQTATSEVLQVISSSPGELEPVFQAMLENAVRICEAKFGTLSICTTTMRFVPSPCIMRRRPMRSRAARASGIVRDPRSSARLASRERKQVVHIDDLAAEPGYIDAIRVSIARRARRARTLLPCRCSRRAS